MNDIKSLKNIEFGRKAYILGNGPSINDHDLSFLKNELVIGMNASTILAKKFNFNQEYYTVSDIDFLKNEEKCKWANEELDKNSKRIFRKELKELENENYKNRTFYLESLGRNGFSKDLSNGYFFGCTTTMLSIQLAYYLGCKNVYLLGVDLKYTRTTPRFYKEENVQNYYRFTSIQIENIYLAYHKFKEDNRNLYICSPASFLRSYLTYKRID